METVFPKLLDLAVKQFDENPGADITLAVYTTQGNTYCCVDFGVYNGTCDYAGTDALLRKMSENADTQAEYIVCLHSRTCVGVISWHFSTELRQLHPENLQAKVLLQGPRPDTYGYKTVAQLLPPKREI